MPNTGLTTQVGINEPIEWNQVNWKKLEKRVHKLQKRIYRASKRGDIKAVRRLQKTLLHSWSAKMIAVRRVTQDNQGKKTAGVDGVKSLTPKQRLNLVGQLELIGKAKPARRVWIPKPGKEEKRPLGIPTMYDRALQALVKQALEPEWEARFEPNSYGFRPGRSCHDAIEAIFLAIRYKAKYVLDADIAKCFDRIDHKALLEKVATFPSLRRQIKAWLKCGVMDKGAFEETKLGTPQGGVISPLLANIALHGLEERVKQYVETLKGGSKTSRRMAISLIRYADDFVVLHEDISAVQKCKEIITDWLKGIGLELSQAKTQMTHTLHKMPDGTKPGFDFLGFTIRQFPMGKHQSGKNTNGQRLGFKTVIRPASKKVKLHNDKLASVIDAHKAAPQAALIKHLNPIIRGWANYYSAVCSKEIFSNLGKDLYSKLRSWAHRRHSNKSGTWCAKKYWHTIGNNNWTFASAKGGNPLILQGHSAIPIVRHTKVKGEASPYDGDLAYWSARMGAHPEASAREAKLLKRQKGKCAYCGLTFRPRDLWEVDHIQPKSRGGKDTYDNLQLLHRHCHDLKSRYDGSGAHDKSPATEEPDEGKLSRPVLKTSGRGNSLA
jgi:RNA-directed DNA polymerase